MPANVTPQQLAVVESVIARFPNGATLAEIAGGFDPVPNERTLRRWVVVLINQRRVERSGSARATRYRARLGATAKSSTVLCGNDRPDITSAERTVSNPVPASGVAEPLVSCAPDVCEQIFAAAIGDIVRYAFSPRAAVDYLQRLAGSNVASVDDRRACLAVMRARLEGFTESDALAYGLERDQYERWRAAQATSAALPVNVGVSMVAADVVRVPERVLAAPEASPAAVSAPAAGGMSSPRGRQVPPPPTRTARTAPVAPTTAGGEPHAEGLALQRMMTDAKGLLTPRRVATAALWTGAVSSASTHLVGGPAASMVTFLMAGVPPLLFVDRDRMAAGDPMSFNEKLATLVGGAGTSMVCAAPVTLVIEGLIGMFR